eukprot:11183661-Lingulodinium_polyedra.AAC.1
MEFHQSVPWRNRSMTKGGPLNRFEDNAGTRTTMLSTPELGNFTRNGMQPQQKGPEDLVAPQRGICENRQRKTEQ